MSNQQPTKSNPENAETTKAVGTANAESLRGKTENVAHIDDAGFIAQGSTKVDNDTKLSDTTFGDAPETTKSVDAESDAQVQTEQDTKDASPETAETAEPSALEAQPEPSLMDADPSVSSEAVNDLVDETLKAPTDDDLEEQNQIELLAGVANEVQGINVEAKTSDMGIQFSGSNALIRLALRLATMGIMVKTVDGEIENANSAQTKSFGSRTDLSNMLWTARIPSGGFGGMTGEIYLRSLRALISEFDNTHGTQGIRAQFLIAPKSKSLDGIEDVAQAYLDGTLISLMDAINSGAKISKHHIIIAITPSDINGYNYFSIESAVDPEVAGMYHLANTLEIITPSLLALTRYVGKIANDGNFAISIPPYGFHQAYVERNHPCIMYGEDGLVTEATLLEIVEEYSFNVIETETPVQDVFNPIFATTQLLELANNTIEDSDIQRFTKSTARVSAQSEHYSHLGGTVKMVTLTLTQAWDLDGNLADDEDYEDDEE